MSNSIKEMDKVSMKNEQFFKKVRDQNFPNLTITNLKGADLDQRPLRIRK